MTDDGLDPGLAGALRDYSRRGLRPIDAAAIAATAVERDRRRRHVLDAPRVARWLARQPAREHGTGWLVIALAAVVVVAVAGSGLGSSKGLVGGGPSVPSPSPPGTTTGSPSPAAASSDSSDLTHSLTVDGLPFSFRLPRPNGWETYGGLLVSKSIAGPQGAEAVVFWAGFPDGTDADPCINAPIELWTASEAADFIASAPGTALVTAPQDVTVGGYPAKYVAVVVREDTGCDPGFFYNWKAQTGGALWVKTLPGDTIRVWLVQVGTRILFIAGETRRDVRPGVALSENALAGLEQEIHQIVDSIQFK